MPRPWMSAFRRPGSLPRSVLSCILAVAALFIAGSVTSGSTAGLLSLAAIMAALAVSFQIVYGILGQLSLGQAALFGVGAYSYGALTSHGVNLVVALIVGAVFGLLAGVAVAAITVRLSQAYFAVATFALASLGAVIVSSSKFLGQDEGLIGVKGFARLGSLTVAQSQLIYTGGAFLLVIGVFVVFRSSRTGVALETVRADPSLAKMLGINVGLSRVIASGMSGLLAGFVGGVFAEQAHFVSPNTFGTYYVITPLAIIAVGGLRSAWAAVIGVVIVVVVPQLLGFSAIANQIFAAIVLFLCVLLLPRGIAGAIVAGWKKLRARVRRPSTEISNVAVPVVLPWIEDEQDHAMLPVADAVSEPVFRAEGIGVRFGALVAVSNVSLSIRAGEVLGLIGANGAGKSTFVNAVTGLVHTTSGEVWVGGQDVSSKSAHARARLGLSRTFQQVLVADDLSVLDNLRVAASRGRFIGNRIDNDRLQSVALHCGLADRISVVASQLTYMHRRLLTIAMALASSPVVIFLDEVTAGLSDEERAAISGVVTGIARKQGTAFLVIEHDVEFVTEVSDRIAVMDRGALIAEGLAGDVLKDAAVVRSYLGTSS
ncbi:MAG: transporter [Subtercola sp.]|nr:transporter [Subtercola sp.]